LGSIKDALVTVCDRFVGGTAAGVLYREEGVLPLFLSLGGVEYCSHEDKKLLTLAITPSRGYHGAVSAVSYLRPELPDEFGN